MSIKRPILPLAPITPTQRLNESAEVARENVFHRVPDHILNHIFSFLPKNTCRAVSLADRRLNHVMAEHYANRAIRSLDHLFRISLPLAFQSFTEEGARFPLSPDVELECKLLKMSRQDQRVRVAIHEESIAQLRLFKADCSAVKDLARVDAARSHQLPAIQLTPISTIDLVTGEMLPVTGTIYERCIMTFEPENTEPFMK